MQRFSTAHHRDRAKSDGVRVRCRFTISVHSCTASHIVCDFNRLIKPDLRIHRCSRLRRRHQNSEVHPARHGHDPVDRAIEAISPGRNASTALPISASAGSAPAINRAPPLSQKRRLFWSHRGIILMPEGRRSRSPILHQHNCVGMRNLVSGAVFDWELIDGNKLLTVKTSGTALVTVMDRLLALYIIK